MPGYGYEGEREKKKPSLEHWINYESINKTEIQIYNKSIPGKLQHIYSSVEQQQQNILINLLMR